VKFSFLPNLDISIYELLLETGKFINSEVELEKLVQRITDVGTEAIGAQFGAFFYNVIGAEGETYQLYTISGVPKEAFSKFPMPRNTKIFDPTFTGKGTVRYDDVTAQSHYGQNSPYHGMPKGHLPVRSYLATSVISPITKEVIGGLFFGHSSIGVFTERTEKLIEGIAAQAAIAMGNARLFEEKRRAEAKQKEQSEQYESIFKATSDSIIIYNEHGFIQEANPAAALIHGYDHDELIGLHASKLFKKSLDFETLKEIAFSGRQYRGTNERIKKDGSVFIADFIGYRFIYRGKPHVLSMVRDKTDEKKVTTALERSEEFAQIITNISPVVLWMTNADGECIYINQTWIDWVGGQIEEYLENGWLDAVITDDRERAVAEFNEAFNKRKVFSSDFRIIRRDGDIRWCSTFGSPYFNKDGSFGGFAGSLTDITERKLAEEKLGSQNVLINTLTNNTLQALFMMDENSYCTYMNPAAEKMTGYKLSDLTEKQLHYYIHHTYPDGRHFPIEESPIDTALPRKTQTEGEVTFIRKNGEFFPVAFIASPIIENGIPKGTVIEVKETTEEKRMQHALRSKEKETMALLEEMVKERTAELEKTNYELMQFTSVASHDLKEPLRKISLFSRLSKDLAKDLLKPEFHEYIDNVIRSSDRMTRLIDDLLSYARLSITKADFQTIDLNFLIEQIKDDLQVSITEKKARIMPVNLPVVRGIELYVGQVFQNLVSNSLKFAHPDRDPVIYINCRREGNNQVIEYKDNGIGFENIYSDKIFELFERLHSRKLYEGTGIGLAIVKKIIDLHGGQILANGVKGEGATFFITLPAAEI
jgi:PAS domain S-box-containing protein